MEFFLGAFERDWERRRAALLHELQMGQTSEFDWDWRKRGGASRLPEASVDGGRRRAGRAGLRAGKGVGRPMRSRFEALARGSQPAVVKLASYGGGGRVGAMISYAAREGQLAVENERGERISGKDGLTGLRGEWEHLFDNRADSRDVAVFNVTIGHVSFDGRDRDAVAREILQTGFGDRRFVFAVDERAGDELTVRGVVVLRDRSGERLTGDRKAAEIVQQRFEDSEFGSGVDAHFRFHGYGNGVRFATARVRDLVERFDREVRDETGRLISTSEDAGDLVQKDWRHEMHSRKGRDVMHLIVSARAGTDLAAFQDAVRDFLGEQFAGHRYVFAVHDPSDDPKEIAEGGKRPHIHAHAIVTMRSETCERIVTSPQVFREWRALMAEKAREHGIDMELTDRRDQASPPAYTRNQVRPVSYVGRTEHEGTSEAAQSRYDAKRENTEMSATPRHSRSYVAAAIHTWRELAADIEDKELANYAALQINRIKIASQKIGQHAETGLLATHAPSNMVMLKTLTEIEEATMQQMTRPEFEAYEKRVEAVLGSVEASIEPSERQDYDEIAAAARDVVSIRREYLELRERETQMPADGRPETDNEAWDHAVVRHGEQGTDRGNDTRLEVEMAREAIDRAVDDGRDTNNADAQLRAELEQAAQLAIAGNSWIREIAETDARVEGEQVISARKGYSEPMIGRTILDKGDGPTVPPANVAPGSADSEAERRGEMRVAERERMHVDSLTQDDQAPVVDETSASRARDGVERTTRSAGREVTPSDPPQQHVPRLQELEREIAERQERERDDRER
ncbi:hypothetical protein [Mesorhizobium sp. KR9-304]|uniref:relaxase/mobilization nuclease domain-containing protein n=1 Tax=Mesorhizobium sp. KR9-304 TaxID=3156614 RepID=UPI0032B52151